MKHSMFLLLLLLSICFADTNKIENHLPMYLDNDVYGHTKEKFVFLIDHISFE